MSTHCSELTLAWKSLPMCGRATLTTVASRLAMALAATVATRAVRPADEWRASPSSLATAILRG